VNRVESLAKQIEAPNACALAQKPTPQSGGTLHVGELQIGSSNITEQATLRYPFASQSRPTRLLK
jgi:hypothetical protein